MTRLRSFEQFFAAIAIAVCGCSFVATALVLFGHIPPVFNQSAKVSLLLGAGLLVFLTAVIGILAASFFSSQAERLRRPVLVLLTLFSVLETLFYTFDKTIISVKNSVLPDASYTVSVGNSSLYMLQPTKLSPYGFRTPRIETQKPEGKRILFLGNSFVQGSGSTFAVNYPQAVEADLHKLLPGQNITVYSAGVNGYGVLDDRLLYKFLKEQGYHFDYVVLNFMLGSDPTNDLPGTVRSSIAGQAQRLHENKFLRYFYPLNTTTFRFLVYLNVTLHPRVGGEGPPEVKGTPCHPSAGYISFSSERAEYYYGAGAQSHIDMAYTMKEIDALGKDAQEGSARFFMVLLPDSNIELARSRDRFANLPMNWNWIRQYLSNRFATKYPFLDLSDSFKERSDLFRCSDTHWNDDGNLHGAEVVADFLAQNISDKSGTGITARNTQ